MTSEKVRAQFLRYFEERGHRVVRSHSLIPPADPSLLFVNAGMVQFKDVFTGARDLGFRRATTTQKCLRVSGKHNDLEQVGRTPRHHTFFEMLGNFSFGDYFKQDAIRFGWELLTAGYGLDPRDLWVTIHPEDREARDIWVRDVGVDPGRIHEDPSNFWAMGDTGPCGPCSEIHIDRGPSFPGASMSDPGDRFMELWNLVFMQFDRDTDGNVRPLPAPSIDTGMGLERLCSVLQGCRSNYESDLFMPLIEMAAGLARKRYGEDPEADVAMRVIADHARATAFLISDGIYPDNEGRGYVLRRLVRRALRFGHKLGLEGPFFTGVVLHVGRVMGSAFPELTEASRIVDRLAGQEEERFLRTLASGMDLLNGAIEGAKARGDSTLDGTTVFVLYDTHGFPADLTAVVAAEHGLTVDNSGFEARMEEQRERGRGSWKGGDAAIEAVVRQCSELRSVFTGYDRDEDRSEVTAVFVAGESVARAVAGDECVLVTAATPFYGESGGQVGDTGWCNFASGGRMAISDTRRPHPDLILHLGKVESGSVAVGEVVSLAVDRERRRAIRGNHSATHLLHLALRAVLGEHVRQRGSLVAPDRLRFDFSHTGPLKPSEVAAVEDAVYTSVLADSPVETDVLPFDEAVGKGALHFFGDKYGDVVRLVRMGESMELCGGTHAVRTGEIGLVRVVSESGISAGVRRIEAVTGQAAMSLIHERDGIIAGLCEVFRADAGDLPDRARKLAAEEKALRKDLAEVKVRSAAKAGPSGAITRVVSGVKVVAVSAEGLDAKSMRELADVMRNEVGSGLVLLTRPDNGKLAVILAATSDVSTRWPANTLLQAILAPHGGRGGGSAMLAQGGAPDRAASVKILDALVETLRS